MLAPRHLTLASGGSVILLGAFDPDVFVAALERGVGQEEGGEVTTTTADNDVTSVAGSIIPTWYYAAPTIHKALSLFVEHRCRGERSQPAAQAGKVVAMMAADGVAEQDRGSSLARVSCPRLRFIRSGAAHLPHQDAVALQHVFGCVVLPAYSMTECTPGGPSPSTIPARGVTPWGFL